MGLSDLTLGWYRESWHKHAEGIDVSELGQAALENYFETLSACDGKLRARLRNDPSMDLSATATTAFAAELAQIIGQW
jgi:hypothetical protein